MNVYRITLYSDVCILINVFAAMEKIAFRKIYFVN